LRSLRNLRSRRQNASLLQRATASTDADREQTLVRIPSYGSDALCAKYTQEGSVG
jgi:hypothetical protein